MNLLTVNLLFSTLVFYLAARIYLLPRLPELRSRSVLVPILLFHSLRHLGLMFLSPGGTYPGLPRTFALPAALGDLLVALLALAAIPAVLREAPQARPLVWIFNVAGSVDLLTAILLGTASGAAPFMGPATWIPVLWVPALLVTHYVTFALLLSRRTTAESIGVRAA